MVALGVLTEEAARSHPDRHRLTQHLGIFPQEAIIEPDERTVFLENGDVFLLCSDGLHDMLADEEIAEFMFLKRKLPEMAEALYAVAMERGGKDNITILLVQARKGGIFG